MASLPLASLLAAIQECWCDKLATSLGGAPADCCSISGEPVVADCCSGYAWVRLINAYPTLDFPAQDTEARRCPLGLWAAVIEIGISRCAAQPCDTLGNVCCESEAAASAILLDDFDRMRFVLDCCLGIPGDTVVPGQWSVRGPEGGCLTSSMRATFLFESTAPVDPI